MYGRQVKIMRNDLWGLKKKSNRIRIIAGTVILSIGLLYTAGNGDIVPGMESDISQETLINEVHDLPISMADGKFDGDESSYSIGGEKTFEDSEKKRSVNILEIVPDKRMAMVGYTIAGQEPIGQADMDAIVNTYPGQDAGWRPNFYTCSGYDVNNRSSNPAITDLAMNAGKEQALYYYAETMNGYYEYVGEGKGVYALKEIPGSWDQNRRSGDYIKDVVMVSKYKEKSTGFATGYNYIWVEDKDLKSFAEETVDHKTLVADVTTGKKTGKKIYVYNHKKNKYVNNELFLCIMSNICSGLDYSKGAYSGAVTGGGPSFLDIPENQYQWPQDKRIKTNSNYDRIQEWRETYNIAVNTREPKEVTAKDVDEADLIIVCRGDSDGSYKTAFGINCYASNDYSPKKNIESYGNDISTNVLKRIYKHVVVDEDVAIAYSCETAPNPQYFNTNIGRLGCMLFYINNLNADNNLTEGESKAGTGRDFFKNLLKDYGINKDGVKEENKKETVDHIGDKPVYEYIYIGDDGRLYTNGVENVNEFGGWAEGKDNFYRNWLYNNDLRGLYYKGYINEWINNILGNNHVEGDFNGLGFYGLDSYISGQYRNQLFYTEDYRLYKYDNDGKAKNIFGIMNKADHTPHYVTTEENTVEKTCFLSANIMNGNSVTPKSSIDYSKNNKSLYINDYELQEMPSDYKLPVKLEIKTSHKIKKIKLQKKDGSKSKEYYSEAGILGAGNFNGLEFTDETTYDENGKAPYNAAKDYYKYSLRTTVPIEKSWFDSGSNNTIIVEITNEVGISQTDMITIVTRNFFMLN